VTKQTFIGHLIQSLQFYIKNVPELEDTKISLLFNTNEHKSGMWSQYLIVQLKDGSYYRIKPERVLRLEDHEQKLIDNLSNQNDDKDEDDVNNE